VECHFKVTPNIVSDWQLSKHSQNAVACDACHNGHHTAASDAAKAKIPTPETCAQCHADRVAQYKISKHAAAWAAMKAIPAFHYQPMAMTEGMKGCGACHKIGVKTEAEIAPSCPLRPPARLLHAGRRAGLGGISHLLTASGALVGPRRSRIRRVRHRGICYPGTRLPSGQ
jgi:predicted CXXCH cytochrome family protein